MDSLTLSTERDITVPGVNEILVTEEHIFVTDIDRHKLIKMDKNGTVLNSVGGEGSCSSPGHFNFPNGLRQSKEKEIYVCDSDNYRIQVFDEDLNLIRVIGARGGMDGCFDSPTDLELDNSGNIYVVEQYNHRIQVLTPEGRHIRYIGRPGTNPGELYNPVSAAMHSDMIYITEPFNGRVSIFSLTGEFVTALSHGLTRPECIAIDEDGYITITCSEPSVMVKF